MENMHNSKKGKEKKENFSVNNVQHEKIGDPSFLYHFMLRFFKYKSKRFFQI
jgi:hypothetical protein